MKKCYLLMVLTCSALASVAQNETATKAAGSSNIEKWKTEMKNYKVDTSAVPDDRITKKINELRTLKGEFNINEVVNIKLQEDLQKSNGTNKDAEQLSKFYTSGDGKRWLNNAVTWIYRKQFTYKELTALVNFYKTSAGQKFASTFPVILMQSSQAAEQINELYKTQQR